MLALTNTSGQQLHCAEVFVEDSNRAVCVVLYSRETSKAVDALRVEAQDLDEALTLVRRWIRPKYIERESLEELNRWVTDEHESWLDILSGRNGLPPWLGSRGARKFPQIEA